MTSEMGSAGRNGEHTASIDPTASVANGTQASQTATTTCATQMGPTARPRLPWLPTDEESGTEPEDLYSQGDRPDPLQTDWERTVGGAVGGNRRTAPLRVLLAEDADCREGRMLDPPNWRACDEPHLYGERAPVTNTSSGVTTYGVDRGCATDYGEPEMSGYIVRDPWYTQSQPGRPCPEAVWGNRTTTSRNVPEPDRTNATARREGGASQGVRCQSVPLDAPDAALRGQRLLAYGERLRREETEISNPGAGRARHPARPRRPTARQEWLETTGGASACTSRSWRER